MAYIGNRPVSGDNNSFRVLDDIKTHTFSFDGSSSSVVSTSDNTITHKGHRLIQGQRVTYTDGTGSPIGGLADGTVYFVVINDVNSFKLASSASNASAGTGINLTSVGSGTAHNITVAFDGVNTKFKATYNDGTEADVTRVAQIQISLNNVIQEPQNTATPTSGFGFDTDSVIVFATAPASNATFWGVLFANNFPTFEISDNDVDSFTGNGSATQFSLSKSPASNENVIVTIDGVVQYPSDNSTTRAYNTIGNALQFSAAPANGADIQARHIGFAGPDPSVAGVTAFYGRTGSVFLNSSDSIVVNDAEVTGNLTVQGDTTTLNTTLRNVELLRVDGNDTVAAGIITQTGSGDILNLYDGSTEVFTVEDGGNVGIGTDNPGSLLHLQGTGGNTSGLTFKNSAGKNVSFYMNNDTSSSAFSINYGGTGGSDIQIGNTGNVALAPSGNANVGIGTYTAESRLHVDGDTKLQGNLSVSGISTLGSGSSGQVILEYQGATRLKTEPDRIDAFGHFNVGGNVDNALLRLGQSNDLVLYHDGDQSFINNLTSNLNINAPTVVVGTGLSVVGVSTFNDDVTLSKNNPTITLSDTNNNPDYQIGNINGVLRFQDTTNNATRIVVDTDGKVGIGTTNPATNLHVFAETGDCVLTLEADRGNSNSNENDNPYIVFRQDGSTQNSAIGMNPNGITNESNALVLVNGASSGGIRFKTGSSGSFTSGTSEKMRITPDGEIRIADGGKITINTSVSGNYALQEALRIDNNNTTSDRAFQIFEYENAGARWHSFNQNLHVTTTGTSYTYTQGNYGGSVMMQMTNGHLRIFNNPEVVSAGTSAITPTEAVTILSNGNVGIGTANPLFPLHISSAMSSSPSFIHLGVKGTNTVGGGGGIAFDTSASESDTTKYIATIAGIRNSLNNGSNDLVFSTTQATVNGNLPSEKLRITSDGNLIHTSVNKTISLVSTQNAVNAGTKIAFFGANRYTTDQEFASIKGLLKNNSGGSGKQKGHLLFTVGSNSHQHIMDDDGNVGIGTDDALARLDVYKGTSATDVDMFAVRSKTGAFNIQCSDTDAANPEWRLRTYANEDLVFSPGGTGSSGEKVRITSAGNVGINTTNPQEKLHITDTGNPKILIEDTSSSNQVGVRFKTTTQNWITGLHGGVSSFKISKSSVFGVNDYFTINGSGNVGIGTDSPQEELTIMSSTPALMIRDSDQPGSYTQVSNANQDMYFSANGASAHANFIFRSGNNGTFVERVRITSDGHIKIPDDAEIRLGGAQTTTGVIKIYSESGTSDMTHIDATSGNGKHIRFIDSISGNTQTELYFGNAPKLSTQPGGILVQGTVSGTTGLITNNDGDIEIGTRSRISAASGTCFVLENSNSGGDEVLRIESDGDIYTSNDQVRDDARLTITKGHVGISTALFLHNSSGSGTASKISSSKGLVLGADVYANSGAGESFISFETDNSERLRITSDGGIILKRASLAKIITDATDKAIYIAGGNDTNVGGNINLFGSTHASHANHIRLRNGGTVAVEIDESGKIGIGTETPEKKLDVYAGASSVRIKGNDDGSFHIDPNSTGGTQETLIGQANGDLRLQSGAASYQANRANILLKNSNKHIILNEDTPTGYVGIGTADPLVKLHVDNPTALGGTSGNRQEIARFEGNVSNNGILEFSNMRLSNGSDWESSAFRIQRIIDVTRMGYIDFGTGAGSGTGGDGRNIQFGSGDGTLMMHLDSEGEVGIGTDNPDAPLHVETAADKSTIAIFGATGDTADTYQALTIRNNVDGYPALANNSSNDVLDIRSAGSVQVTIDDNNNNTGKFFRVVSNGQGTGGTELIRIKEDGGALFGGLTSQANTDTSKLAVQGGDSNIGIIQVHAGGGENNDDLAGITFSHGTDDQSARAKAAIALRCSGAGNGRGDLCFYTDNTADNNQVSSADERLRITSDGNFGFGTAVDPGDTLRVFDIGNFNTGNGAGSLLRLLTRESDGTDSTSADFVKYKTGGLVINNNEKIGTTGFISFGTATGGGATQERLRITSDGKIGVNQAAPSASLEVRPQTGTGLGETADDELDLAEFGSGANATGGANDVKLLIQNVRLSDGNNWTTTTTRIQRRVDVTDQSYIDFGTGGGASGGDIELGYGARVNARIVNSGGVGIATVSSNNGVGQLRYMSGSTVPDNIVGGITVNVDTGDITGDIKIPRNGHIMAVTTFTDDAGTSYPQPSGAGLIYVDVGPSKKLSLITQNNVSGNLRTSDSMVTDITSLTNNNVTFMPGSTNGTIRIANRWATSPTTNKVMIYLTFM